VLNFTFVTSSTGDDGDIQTPDEERKLVVDEMPTSIVKVKSPNTVVVNRVLKLMICVGLNSALVGDMHVVSPPRICHSHSFRRQKLELQAEADEASDTHHSNKLGDNNSL
jgi:biotin synthase-like enzyme